MAVCSECGKKLGFLEAGSGGMCTQCAYLSKLSTEEVESFISKTEQAYERKQEIEAIVLTTETAPKLNITRRIEVISAEVAYGMNIFKDLFADVRDIVGGRSAAVQNTMRDARRTALYELKKEAHEVGANAVVGVDLDYVELSSHKSMVMLVASGTAVVIED